MDDTTESHILSELSDILQEQKTSTNSTLNTSEAWRLKMYINRIRKVRAYTCLTFPTLLASSYESHDSKNIAR